MVDLLNYVKSLQKEGFKVNLENSVYWKLGTTIVISFILGITAYYLLRGIFNK